MEGGVHPDIRIFDFIEKGFIKSNQSISNDQIQPSSLDLRCGFGKHIWHMPFSCIPHGNVKEFLDANAKYKLELTKKTFIHKGKVYVIELEEELSLPEEISAKSNPKSTTGRLDIHTRLITENGQIFDGIKKGYSGKLFLEVISHSFDLFLSPGYSFNQIRFFNHTAKLDQDNLNSLAKSSDILVDSTGTIIDSEKFVLNGAVNLTVDLNYNDPGYKVRADAPELDLASKKSSLPFSKYFEKINLNDNGLTIIPDTFYLLKSKEFVNIPQDHCAEMADILTDFGEYRAHYAGFFDPNFRSIAVMEVRNTGKTPFLLKNGQIISALWFYKLTEKPKTQYGDTIGSSYQGYTRVSPAKFFYDDISKAA